MVPATAMGVTSAAEKEPQRSERDGGAGRDRLGGARADFVANLGKRRSELRTTLDNLRADPAAKRPRDELRRRVHALAAGAKLLRFSKLADELKLVEARLEEASQRGSLEDGDFGAVHDLIGRITSLAWGQTSEEKVAGPVEAMAVAALRQAPEMELTAAHSQVPTSVLVVGGSPLADALALPAARAADDDGQLFEVERTSDAAVALDLGRALAPDVIVIDGDLPEAKKLITDVLGDPLTEAIPVLVTLKLTRSDEAGPFLALGVARVLAKPVSPGELRRACAGAVSAYVKREVTREPLGELTVDQLGQRLAEELRRGLCDTIDPEARSSKLQLGEGTEMLAALWGAVARIRDVVTIRTQGQVRFALGGPEGAVPMAPWLESSEGPPSGKRSSGRVGRADADTSLEKAKVLVADDDAAVCWFLAGVLKTAGATVYEARDGERALEIAKHVNPDLLVSDILMPKMDGFSLSRVMRRDLVLRDVPIVLLSWKEDLLQRVRELGADADGYLRKEASAGAIVQRARELVRGRRRVAQRIGTKGEVRGRLDGLTTLSLLRMVSTLRENSTVSVRDASYLYEIEVRKGRPVRATRTALSGAFERGSSVLGALLGVGDGRFSVSAPREDSEVGPVQCDLYGSLNEQVMPVIATARAAQRLLTGPNLMRVKRVEIDDEAMAAYASATPEIARALMSQISAGACPRDLVTGGVASPRLLEDVLVDAAVHGAVYQVIDGDGEDRLPEATATELSLLRGERTAAPIANLPVLGVKFPSVATSAPTSPAVDVSMPAPVDLMKLALARPPAPIIDAAGNSAPLSTAIGVEGAPQTSAALGAEPSAVAFEPEISAPAVDGLEVAAPEAMQTSPATPAPLPTPQPSPSFMDLVETSARKDSPSPRPVVAAEVPPPPSSGPRKITPAPAAVELTPTPSSLPPPPGLKPMLSLGSLHPPPVMEAPAPPPAAAQPTPKPKNTKKSPAPPAVVDAPKERNDLTPRFPRPSAFLSHAPPQKKKDHKTLYWVAFALVGVVFAVWARWSRDRPSESAMIAEVANKPTNAESSEESTVAVSEPTSAPESNLADTTDASAQQPKTKVEDAPLEELPLRDGEKVKKGQGVLEIIAGKSDTIYVDGKPVGSGPVVTLPMKARKEAYEVRLKTRGDERSRYVTVKEGKLVRLRLAPPWQR